MKAWERSTKNLRQVRVSQRHVELNHLTLVSVQSNGRILNELRGEDHICTIIFWDLFCN